MPATTRRPWLRPLLLLLLVGELIGASAALRSDLFVREPLTRLLNRLGARLGGEFYIGPISPRGLTGIELERVRFVPTRADVPPFDLLGVAVFPDIGHLLRGRLAVDEVVIDDLRAAIDEAGFRRMRERLAHHEGDPSGAPAGRRLSALPNRVRVSEATVTVSDGRLASGTLALSFTDLAVDRESGGPNSGWAVSGRVGLGQGGADHLSARLSGGRIEGRLELDGAIDWLSLVDRRLHGLPESVAVDAEAVTLTRVGALRLEGVTIGGSSGPLPGLGSWELVSLRAAEVCLRRSPSGVKVTLRDGSAQLASGERTAHIPIARAVAWSGSEGQLPSATARLGGPGLGQLEVSVSPAPELGTWRISAVASRYAVAPWAELLGAEAPLRLSAGHFTGALSAIVEPAVIEIEVDGTLEAGQANVPFLAARPLRDVTAGLRGDITLDGEAGSLQWRSGRLLVAGVPILFEADLSWGDAAPRLRLEAALIEVDASQLRRGLPAGLAPALEQVVVAGTLSARLKADLDTARPDEAVLELVLDASHLRVLDYGLHLPLDQLAGDFLLEVPTEDGVGRTIGPERPGWVAFDQVAGNIVPALISAEDGHFFEHDGFDWRAIEASVEVNLRERRVVRGGSTISQQVVRSLFLGHERTLGRKFEEAFLTWQLESVLSKERIMELYVNVVHWGPGVFGVAEAAATYFRRRPEDLTVGETGFLASILSNPDYFGTQYARRIVTPSRREKICNILHNMRNGGAISAEDERQACEDVQRGVVSVVPPPEWLVDPIQDVETVEEPVATAVSGLTLAAMR